MAVGFVLLSLPGASYSVLIAQYGLMQPCVEVMAYSGPRSTQDRCSLGMLRPTFTSPTLCVFIPPIMVTAQMVRRAA